VKKVLIMLIQATLVKTGTFLIEAYLRLLATPFFIFELIIGKESVTPKP
jgi:hypothetical protein